MISQESKKKNWFRWSVDQDPLCMTPSFQSMFGENGDGLCRMDRLAEARSFIGKNGGFVDFCMLVDGEVHDRGFPFADMNYPFWEKVIVPNWRENRSQIICEVLPYAFAATKARDDESGFLEVVYPVFSTETITGPNGEQRKVFFPENERDRLADFTKEYFSE